MSKTPLPDKGFLSDASGKLKQMLAEQASEIALKSGEVLFEQGDEGDALYAILSGSLEFSILSVNGRKLSLDMMGPGAVFGEIALFDPGSRTATVTALRDSRLLRVRNSDVLQRVQSQPEMANDLIRLAGKRMRWMGSQTNEQVFLPMPTRLARKLLYLVNVGGVASPEPLSLSQAELAEHVGATREAVSKTLSSWKKDGVIAATRKGLTITDVSAMEALAQPDEI